MQPSPCVPPASPHPMKPAALSERPEKTEAARGRTPRTDGDATRARILQAAGELFAQTGFAETTSKTIAMRAGVDLASINYHFGSRGGLYQAVLIEAHRQLMSVDALKALYESPAPPSERLRQFFAVLVTLATRQETGWQLNVLAAEILSPSSHMQALFQEEVLPKATLLTRLVQEITGLPPDDPALTICLVSTISPCLMMLLTKRGDIPGPLRTARQTGHDILVDTLHRYAMAGLRACAAQKA